MGSRTIINDHLDEIKTLVKNEGLVAATYQPAFEKLFQEDQAAQQRLKEIKEAPLMHMVTLLTENPNKLNEAELNARSQIIKNMIDTLEVNFKKEWLIEQLKSESISFA